MSEGNGSCSAPGLVAGSAEDEGGSSRSSSPGHNDVGPSAEILEHSLESLIVSDSSEECSAQTRGFEAEGSAEQLEVPGGVNAADTDEEAGGVKEGEAEAKEVESKGESKRKKRRISSRRTRTVKLSASDIVLCEVAGVQVRTDDLHNSMHSAPLSYAQKQACSNSCHTA